MPDVLLRDTDGEFRTPNGRIVRQTGGVFDLVGDDSNQTADHYTDQWGAETDFQSFARQKSRGDAVHAGRQLGWADLLDRIRTRAQQNSHAWCSMAPAVLAASWIR
jgi:hypothetical protein